MHSKMYEQIKNYYACGMWSKNMVRNAVVKGKITAAEYAEITGEQYTV